jgi:hypothetical protein
MYGGKNWDLKSVLVPDQAKKHCRYRWYSASDPRIDGGRNWDAIAALVPVE